MGIEEIWLLARLELAKVLSSHKEELLSSVYSERGEMLLESIVSSVVNKHVGTIWDLDTGMQKNPSERIDISMGEARVRIHTSLCMFASKWVTAMHEIELRSEA